MVGSDRYVRRNQKIRCSPKTLCVYRRSPRRNGPMQSAHFGCDADTCRSGYLQKTAPSTFHARSLCRARWASEAARARPVGPPRATERVKPRLVGCNRSRRLTRPDSTPRKMPEPSVPTACCPLPGGLYVRACRITGSFPDALRGRTICARETRFVYRRSGPAKQPEAADRAGSISRLNRGTLAKPGSQLKKRKKIVDFSFRGLYRE